MKSIDSTFTSEKNKQANQPIHLFVVENYDGNSNNLTLTDYDTNVTYNGVTYTKFPISFETISENSEGRIDTVRIVVSNISQVIEDYLETYDWRGKKVSIITVWANQLNDTDAYLQDVFYIDNYSSDQNNAYFTCASKFDVLDVHLPRRLYMRHHCCWEFKSTECGYSGGESTCNLTKARCKELNNYDRFGGFPSIPTRRVYIG